MEFGLAYEMQRPSLDDHAVVEETIEQCILADEMGFDYVWFVEHHFLTTFSSSPCPEVIFGALSRLTKNIRLGFGVVILPYHHPVRVAERVAMVDQLSHGRVDLGTGRSAPYEQTGMGIDPRNTRDMWEESLTMIPKIWESDTFEWSGKFWNVPPRQVLPKPYQQPHPPIWVAALQPATYQLAANKGIGVMALGVSAPSVLEPHIQQYRETVQNANPVGATVNNQWLSSIFGYCGEDNSAARELCTQSLKTFFGPGRPYVQDQKDVYARLLEQWGGIPEHLVQNFPLYRRQGIRRRGRHPVRPFRGYGPGAEDMGRGGRRYPGRPGCNRGRGPGKLHQRREAARSHRRGPGAVPDGHRDHWPRQCDEVHRAIRQARNTGVQIGEVGQSWA